MPAPAAVMFQRLLQNLLNLSPVARPVLPIMLGRVISEGVGFAEFDIRNIDFSHKWIHSVIHLFYLEWSINEIITFLEQAVKECFTTYSGSLKLQMD